MAALRDRNGVEVKVGDKVRTPFGDVVQIAGRLPKRREIKMVDCQIVPRETPVGGTVPVPPATDEVLFA